MNNARREKNFFATLDAIRGMAALLVVVFHVSYFHYVVPFKASYLAVDVFFMLSGVVIANAYDQRLAGGMSMSEFMWHRIVRIYPLYLLGCILSVIYFLFFSGADRPSHLGVGLILQIFFIPSFTDDIAYPLNLPAWSLLVELLANLLYCILFPVLSRRLNMAIVLFGIAGVAVVIALNGNLNLGFRTSDLPLSLLRGIYPFFIGLLMFRMYKASGEPRVNPGKSPYMPWALTAIISGMLMAKTTAATAAYYDFAAVLIFPAIIYAALLFDTGPVTTRLFKWLGMISYPVYAIHVPLSHFIPEVMRWLQIVPRRNGIVGLVFVVLLVALAWLLDKYVDIPARRMILRASVKNFRGYTVKPPEISSGGGQN